MTVKVLITRRFKEDKVQEAMHFLNQLRTGGINQPGYIMGETLFSMEDPQKLVVISAWESKKHWDRWCNDPVRKRLVHKMEQMLLDPVQYEVFSFGTLPRKD